MAMLRAAGKRALAMTRARRLASRHEARERRRMATMVAERAERDRWFFTGANLAVALFVFAGFARTYYLAPWVSQPTRAPPLTLLLHLHALIFTAWILLGVIQPALIATGRRSLHRRLGYGGAGLAVLVWLLGNLAAVAAMKTGFREVGDPFAFYAITFFSIQAFGLIVFLAIRWRNRPETHKRMMLLSSAAILEAAVGRLPLHWVAAAAPLSFYIGADLVIAAGIFYDQATRGRIHAVWRWGGGMLVASQFLRIAIMSTTLWLAFAHAIARL
jgi:hypothetical protein